MVVIVEEEKNNKVSLLSIISWAVILAIIAVAVYYIFFKNPEVIEISVPAHLRSTQEISQIQLDPERIVNDPKFEVRRQYVSPPIPVTLGRPNPFIPF